MAARRPVQRAPPGAAPSPLGTRPRFGGPLARAPRLAHAPFRGGVRVLVHRRRRHRPPHQAPRTRRGAPGRARRPDQTSPESHPTHRPRRPRLRRQTQTHRREGHRPRAPPRPPRPNLYPRVHRSSASARTTRDRPRDARAATTGADGGGSVRGLGTWRGAHFAAPARDPTTGLPTSATSLEDAADASRRRYGVAADIRERAGSACQETSAREARLTRRGWRRRGPRSGERRRPSTRTRHRSTRRNARPRARRGGGTRRPRFDRRARAPRRRRRDSSRGKVAGAGVYRQRRRGRRLQRARRVARPRGRGRISAGGRRRSSRDR